MDGDLEVIVGTYEELTLGYFLQNTDDVPKLVSSFTDHSHTASVRAVAVSESGIAATGSADESIKLFNLRKRTELGSLLHHDGSVTGLWFFGKSHLFSCSEDGTIAVWQVGTWECLRVLRGHKSAVYYFAVHPSGKLALSVGKDKTLRTWNLITGRSAYVTNIKEVADLVLWSPDGSKYIIVVGNRIDVYAFKTATVVHQIHVDNRVSSAVFLTSDILAVGCERGLVVIYSLTLFNKLHVLDTATNRVKAMSVHQDLQNLVVASSDGFIKLYHYKIKQDEVRFKQVAELNTGFRLLCVCSRIPSHATTTETDAQSSVCKDEQGVEEKHQDGLKTAKAKKRPASSDTSVSVTVSVDTDEKEKDVSRKLKKKKRRLSSVNGDSSHTASGSEQTVASAVKKTVKKKNAKNKSKKKALL